MEDRFINILKSLSGNVDFLLRESPYWISQFEKVGEAPGFYKYKLTTEIAPLMDSPYPNLKHRGDLIFMTFYAPVPDDNIFSIVIEHVVGMLGGLRDFDDFENVESLCRLFVKNRGSFAGTGAYLGLTFPENNETYAVLNSTLSFLDKWDDQDIVTTLVFHLRVMFYGFENNWDNSIPILKRFGDSA